MLRDVFLEDVAEFDDGLGNVLVVKGDLSLLLGQVKHG